MIQWIKIWHTQKERTGLLYENDAGKKIVGHSKQKLWTSFWGHGEREQTLKVIHVHHGWLASV